MNGTKVHFRLSYFLDDTKKDDAKSRAETEKLKAVQCPLQVPLNLAHFCRTISILFFREKEIKGLKRVKLTRI